MEAARVDEGLLERGALPTEAGIRRLVWAFYARVFEDSELGPIFERRIDGRREAHLERMVDFWSSVLLGSGRFRGNPALVHRGIEGLEPRHFDRWIELFRSTANELFSPHAAADVVGRALRMRVVLESALPRHDVPEPGLPGM